MKSNWLPGPTSSSGGRLSLEQAPDFAQKGLHLGRLRDEYVRLEVVFLVLRIARIAGGEHDDRDSPRRGILAQPSEEREAIEAGHDAVGDDEIGRAAVDLVEPLETVGGGHDIVLFAFENRPQEDTRRWGYRRRPARARGRQGASSSDRSLRLLRPGRISRRSRPSIPPGERSLARRLDTTNPPWLFVPVADLMLRSGCWRRRPPAQHQRGGRRVVALLELTRTGALEYRNR